MDVSMIDLLTTGKLPLDDEFPKAVIHMALKQHGRQATAAKALNLARELNPNKTLPMKIQEQLKDFFRDVSELRSKRHNDIQERNAGFKGTPITPRMLGLKVYRSARNALRASKNHGLVTIGVTVHEKSLDYGSVGDVEIDVIEIHIPIKHYHFNVGIRGKPQMVENRMDLKYYELDGNVTVYQPGRMKYQRNAFYVSRRGPDLKVTFDRMHTSRVTQPPRLVLYQHGTPMPKQYGTAPLNVLGA